jgi:SAM-dependent methyltransferase
VAELRGAGHAARVRALFDHKASGWPAKYAPDGPLTGRLAQLAAVLSYHLPANGRVLDLGCGTGEPARYIAAAGLLVVGCDIAPKMLHQAAAAGRQPGACWVQLAADWRTLPMHPASVDAIVAASVLEYVQHPAAVLAECARVLRPGGIMVCTVPDPAHPVRWLERLAALAPLTALARPADCGWPRLRQYVCYLQTSRQRWPAKWWSAVAARAGLCTVEQPAAGARRAPMRLLTFQRPGPVSQAPVQPQEVE